MDEVTVDRKLAETIWAILVSELGADPDWREATLDALVAGTSPVPFVATVGARTVQTLAGSPPRLQPPWVDSLERNALYLGQVWASQKIASLYGTVYDGESYARHSFPAHGNLRDHRTHCLQCGVSFDYWQERMRTDCPLEPPAKPLGGHSFPLEAMINWPGSCACAHCQLVYPDWLSEGCPPCPLVPLVPTRRERPSPLAGRA